MGFDGQFERGLRKPDLAVVGGGLLGRLLAWRAVLSGMRVELYEAGGSLGEESAAWAAAGMIAPVSESLDATAELVAMGRRSLKLWPGWLAELPVPVYYRDVGTLAVWRISSEAERFERAARSFEPGAGVERVGRERLMELEPVVAATSAEALYLPGEGHIDNREVLAALATALEEIGVICHWRTRVSGDALPKADMVADCRGMGARKALTGLCGVRGEILRLYVPGVELRHMVRLLDPVCPVYVVPRADGRLVVGATAYESEDRSPASVGGVMRLLTAAVSLLPGLAEARILEFATQMRPAFADRQPVIRWEADGRVLRINGLYRHGFLLSPAVVEEAVAMLLSTRESMTLWHDTASL